MKINNNNNDFFEAMGINKLEAIRIHQSLIKNVALSERPSEAIERTVKELELKSPEQFFTLGMAYAHMNEIIQAAVQHQEKHNHQPQHNQVVN